LRDEKAKRDVEEMKVLTIFKLMKQKERQKMEIESREKQKLLDAISQEAKDRLDAAEALIMLSKEYIKFDTAENDEIIEEKLEDDPDLMHSSAEYVSEFKEVYQEPEGPKRKFRLTEKKIKVFRCKVSD
jgi:hypothetical protein